MITISFPDINSTSELLSIALAGEREAIRRYSELAKRMQEYGNDEAGTLFEGMIDEERAQEKQLAEWAELEGLTIHSNVKPVRWEDPGVATIYDAQAVDPNQSTPYKALAFVAHNKERAFRFYSYVAATSKDPDVRAYAEMLARKKLSHTATLRERRRHAWHAQRSQYGTEPRINPALIKDIPDLLAIIICIEQILVDLMDAIVNEYPDLQELIIKAQDFLSASDRTLQKETAPDVKVTAKLESIKAWHRRRLAAPEDESTTLRRLCVDCERSFAFYDAVVTSTQDESIMLMAQRLSSHALERISVIRQLSGGCCPHISPRAPL